VFVNWYIIERKTKSDFISGDTENQIAVSYNRSKDKYYKLIQREISAFNQYINENLIIGF
jgi:hypothetical protein